MAKRETNSAVITAVQTAIDVLEGEILDLEEEEDRLQTQRCEADEAISSLRVLLIGIKRE